MAEDRVPLVRLTDHGACIDPWEACGQDDYCKRGCHEQGGCTNGCKVPNLYWRLYAYEETGLTPEQVIALQTDVVRLVTDRDTEKKRADAAVQDLNHLAEGNGHCNICAHDRDGFDPLPPHCKYIGDRCYEWRGPCAENAQDSQKNALNAIPAADVVPVVRCKYCRHWNGGERNYGECDKLGDRDREGGASFDCDTEANHYCAEGYPKGET